MSAKITRKSLGDLKGQGKTDLTRLKKIKDEDIDDSDIPELGSDFWKNAKLVMPREKKPIALRLDVDVLDWMKAQGRGYQSRINAILRAYYESHRNPS